MPKRRAATRDEVLAMLLQIGVVVKQGDKYYLTPAGIRFVADRPPHAVTDYIPGAKVGA